MREAPGNAELGAVEIRAGVLVVGRVRELGCIAGASRGDVRERGTVGRAEPTLTAGGLELGDGFRCAGGLEQREGHGAAQRGQPLAKVATGSSRPLTASDPRSS